MKKALALMLSLVMMFSLGACTGSQNAKTPANQMTTTSTTTTTTPQQTEDKDEKSIEIPIAEEMSDKLTVSYDPAENDSDHVKTLVSVYETKSVEAGNAVHPGEDWGDGWLFGIVELDRVGMERYASYDQTGFEFFAKKADSETYYLYTHPTDVRMMRENDDMYSDEASMAEWTAAVEWAGTMKDTILAANENLEPYSLDSLTNGFTYDGDHKYFSYTETIESAEGEKSQYITIFTLSQPTGTGEDKIWAVERSSYQSPYDDEPYVRLYFPAGLDIDETANEYYAHQQEKADAGEATELLDPRTALLSFIEASGVLGDEVNAENLVEIASEG